MEIEYTICPPVASYTLYAWLLATDKKYQGGLMN